MKSRFSRHLRRLALLGLIVVGSTNPVAVTHAQELDGDSGAIAAFADWCGWGTHDSMPIIAAAVKPPVETTLRPSSRTASGFEQSLAAFAAAATAKVGFSFEQIIEPFAMVGSHQSDSLDKINEFQEWWEVATNSVDKTAAELSDSHDDDSFSIVATNAAHTSAAYVPFVDFDGKLAHSSPANEIRTPDWQEFDDDGFNVIGATDLLRRKLDLVAQEEPIDANVNDELNRIFAKPFPSTVIPKDRVVGASPIIVTLDEAYLPYDLAQRDLRPWLPTSLAIKPFCLRLQSNSPESDPMWTEHIEVEVAKPSELQQASADCLLDEWIWNVEQSLESGSSLRQAMSPKSLGSNIAWLANHGSRVTSKATRLIASVWPEIPAKPAASRQLLARAEATEAAPVDQLTSYQISRTVAVIQRWWASAQTFQQDWLRVANVNSTENPNR